MKTKCFKKVLSIMLLVILVSGCLEYTVTTRILPDGSIERTIEVKGDSAGILHGTLPVPVDSTWEITAGYEEKSGTDSSHEKTYVYTARKIYRNDRELNHELNPAAENEGQLMREVKVDKRFRWFNTFYRYTEIYKQAFPFRSKPVNDFMTDHELELALADDNERYYLADSDKLIIIKDSTLRPVMTANDSMKMKEKEDILEQKFNDWMKVNLYEEFFIAVKAAIVNTKKMKPAMIEKTKHELFDLFDTKYSGKEIFNMNIFEPGDNNLLFLASSYYHIDSAVLHEANREGFDAISKKTKNMIPGYGDSYSNLTIMPGIIISTNATDINGNTVSWEVNNDSFFAKDLVLSAESRKLNKGPVLISGAFVILLLIVLIAGMFRNTVRKNK